MFAHASHQNSSPAVSAGRADRRQLEKALSLTPAERMRCLWYRARLTVQEMNYATRRLAQLQARLP